MLQERYRPTTLQEYAFNTPAHRDTIHRMIQGGDLDHMIIWGSAGTGKTSLVRVLQNELRVLPDRVLKINGSATTSKGGLESIVGEFVQHQRLWHHLYDSVNHYGRAVIWIEESDRLDDRAQDYLKAVIDDCAELARFIFTCNNGLRMSGPLRSRCTELHFKTVEPRVLQALLGDIARLECIEATDTVINRIILQNGTDIRSMVKALGSLPKKQVDSVQASCYNNTNTNNRGNV